MSRNLEILSLDQRKNLIEKSNIVHSQDEASTMGLTKVDILNLCFQVSDSINKYNQDHPGEMLPKKPEDIWESLKAGESTLIFSMWDSNPVFLYHGAIYNLFSFIDPESGESINVFEFGTDIVNQPFRNMGLGKKGVIARVDKVYSYGENSVGISTIKEARTAHVWKHTGNNAAAISWEEYPHLATLTDVCSQVSPIESGEACPYRRTSENSDESTMYDLLHHTRGSVPCTLLTLDVSKAKNFESWANSQHERLTGQSQPSKVDDRLNPEQFMRINEFYTLLRGGHV